MKIKGTADEMNSVYFKDGKIYLNGNRIPYVTDIEIKKQWCRKNVVPLHL